jgi:septal ring factor EnvC (AmiA/AmiB activator)
VTRLAPVLFMAPLLLAASAPMADELKQARTEQASAEAETARLERIAAGARDEASRLQAQEAAAAQGIEAAEARITAADAQLRLVDAYVAARRQRLAQQQQPIASLLAGLAEMGRRPPLLAIADNQSLDQFVEVRVLLDSTLPVIRARTTALSAELAQGQKLEQQAADARAELVHSKQILGQRRQQFAALEQRALRSAATVGGQALSAGDIALAAGESVEHMQSEQAASRGAWAMASALAAGDQAPARPSPPEGPRPVLPFAYALPANAPVSEGFEAVNENGIRSRGVTLATSRGAQVSVPAGGVIRFSGPFRDYDGVVIIDHGRGWMSLIVNVGSTLKAGDRVEVGQPLGRALGPLGVELSQNGHRVSPALIAGSSQTLSKSAKGG